MTTLNICLHHGTVRTWGTGTTWLSLMTPGASKGQSHSRGVMDVMQWTVCIFWTTLWGCSWPCVPNEITKQKLPFFSSLFLSLGYSQNGVRWQRARPLNKISIRVFVCFHTVRDQLGHITRKCNLMKSFFFIQPRIPYVPGSHTCPLWILPISFHSKSPSEIWNNVTRSKLLPKTKCNSDSLETATLDQQPLSVHVESAATSPALCAREKHAVLPLQQPWHCTHCHRTVPGGTI